METKKQSPVINKIEVDGTTGEPVIVEISAEEFEKQTRVPTAKEDESASAIKKKSSGKQVVMTKILGFNDDNAVTKRQKLFKNIFSIGFCVLVIGVLAFTFYKDFFSKQDRPDFDPAKFQEILSTSWFNVIFALFALFLCFFLKGLKMSVLCKSMTGKFHLRTCLETAVIGHYYNNLTPLAVGGQPFEIYHLSKHGIHGGVAASLPIATFFLNQFAFVLFTVISLMCFNTNALGMPAEFINQFAAYSKIFTVLAWIGLALCLLMPSLVVVFSVFPKIGASLVKFAIFIGFKLHIVKNPTITKIKTFRSVLSNSKCLKRIGTKPFVFITSFLIAVGEHLALTSIAYFTLRFFGFNIPTMSGITEWFQICMLCSVLYSAISFIPTPGNSGAADFSFFTLFEIGLMTGLAFPAMILWRALSYYSFIIVGFIFTTVKRKSDHRKLMNDIE